MNPNQATVPYDFSLRWAPFNIRPNLQLPVGTGVSRQVAANEPSATPLLDIVFTSLPPFSSETVRPNFQ